MLLRNITEMRGYLGRAINADFSFDSLQPYIELAQQEYIKKGIGTTFFSELDNQHNQVNGATLSASNLAILPLVQRALAFYTYHKYLPYSIGSDGDNGLQETETDSTKPVRIGVLEKRQRETIENASNAMEEVLQLLYANKALYGTFWNSAFGVTLKNSWFVTAEQLTKALPLVANSYRLLLTLNRYFEWAETAKLLPVVGSDILAQIKTTYQEQGNTPASHITLYRLVRQYIAWVAYNEALLFLNTVQTPSGGLRVLSEFDGINNTKTPDTNQWSEYRRSVNNHTESAYFDLVGFLNKNAETFPAFKTQSAYKPDSSRLPDNSKYKSIFRMK